MKQIGEPRTVTADNAWGRSVKVTHAIYEIEREDVGRKRDHHLGVNHKSHVFTYGDIGRTIIVYTDGSGWTCWNWSK